MCRWARVRSWHSVSLAGPARCGPTVDRAVAPDGVVAAMQRDLGLTEAQARTRLRQESRAIAVDPAARAAAGAAYGGSWFDAERGKLVVGVTTSDSTRTRGRGPGDRRGRWSAVAHTAGGAGRRQGQAGHGRARRQDVAGWRVDPRSGSVVVTVRRGARRRRLPRRGTESRAGDRRGDRPRLPRPFAAGTVGGDPYYINGNVRCSIGFSVHGGFVSAGHCGGVGSSVAGWDGSCDGQLRRLVLPGQRLLVHPHRRRLVDRAGRARLGHRARPAGARLGRGAGRLVDLPVRLDDALALRHGAREERDGQLRAGRGAPDDEDERVRRTRRLRRLVHHR